MTTNDSGRKTETWVSIIVLGSLWGFSEVVLGAGLRTAGFPFASALLTAIGVGLMAIAVARFSKPWTLPLIAVVAILCKQLVVPVLQVSVMCKANSCLAVLLQGLGLSATVAVAGKALRRGLPARAASGAAGALVGAIAFYPLGQRLAPCPYLTSFAQRGGLATFLTAEGIPWAALSALLFPAGYWLGSRLEGIAAMLRVRKPLLYYAANAALVVLCWVASVVTIAAGF